MFREITSSCLLLTALLLSFSYSQSINYLSPNSGQEGINGLQVYLYASGVNFYDSYGNYGNPNSISFSDGGISTNNLQIVNSSTIKFDIDISENTNLTSRDVTLYSSGGYWSLYKEDAFNVTESPWINSEITSISPTEVQADGQYQINIYTSGVNFTDPYSSTYSPFESLNFSGGEIDVANTQVYSDVIQATIDVDRFAYTTERGLTVNTDNYTFYLNNALKITPTDPIEIISVSPTEGEQGTNNLTLTIDILNVDFYDMYLLGSVYFSNSDLSGSSISSQSVVDQNTIQVNVDISPWTDPGYYDLTLGIHSYYGGQVENDTYSGFEVTQGDHELLSISPNSAHRSTDDLIITLLASGVNFNDSYANNSVSFSGSGISVNWVNTTNYNELQAQIDVSSSANSGFRDITVTTGNQIIGLEDAFEVKYPEATLNPNQGSLGDSFEVSLIGSGITFDDMYGIQNVSFSGSGLNISNINQTSDKTMTFYLSIGDAQPGMRNLYIDQYSGYGDDYSFNDVFEILNSNIAGCMDGLATNYNSEAVEDDGSCIYPDFSPYIYLEISNSLVDSSYNIHYTISQDNGESIIQSGSLDSDYGTFNINNLSVGEIIGNGTFIQKPLDLDTTFIEYQVEVAQNPDSNHVNVYTRVISSNDNEFPIGLIFGGYILTNKYPGINMYAENPSPYERTSYFISTLNLNNLFMNPDFNDIVFSANLTSLENDNFSQEIYFDIGIEQITGCTDNTALNYNSNANIDDNSCDYLATLSFGNVIRDYENNYHYIEILLNNSNSNLRGFQFDLEIGESLYLQNVSGGLAEDEGFEVVYNSNRVIGYNIEGDSIMEQVGILTNLTLEGSVWIYPIQVCIIDEVLIGPTGDNQYTSDTGECITIENEIGDVNMDSLIDVLDVVMIVNYALGGYADSYQFWASDLNTDGIINVQDIVMEIDIIIGISNLARIKHLEEAKINLFKDKITVSSEGTIAGIELHTSGDFTITSSTLSQGWEFYQNNDIIILVDMIGSGISEDIILYYDGTMQIKNNLLSDWSGNAISANLNIIPDTYILQTAYPNPFNPTTTLSFAIPVDSEIVLSIYNMQGREVSRLIDGNMDAGYHSVTWDANSYSSGVYFVKMIAEDFSNTQKIMLIK